MTVDRRGPTILGRETGSAQQAGPRRGGDDGDAKARRRPGDTAAKAERRPTSPWIGEVELHPDVGYARPITLGSSVRRRPARAQVR